jgi:hypothetical protein
MTATMAYEFAAGKEGHTYKAVPGEETLVTVDGRQRAFRQLSPVGYIPSNINITNGNWEYFSPDDTRTLEQHVVGEFSYTAAEVFNDRTEVKLWLCRDQTVLGIEKTWFMGSNRRLPQKGLLSDFLITKDKRTYLKDNLYLDEDNGYANLGSTRPLRTRMELPTPLRPEDAKRYITGVRGRVQLQGEEGLVPVFDYQETESSGNPSDIDMVALMLIGKLDRLGVENHKVEYTREEFIKRFLEGGFGRKPREDSNFDQIGSDFKKFFILKTDS